MQEEEPDLEDEAATELPTREALSLVGPIAISNLMAVDPASLGPIDGAVDPSVEKVSVDKLGA